MSEAPIGHRTANPSDGLDQGEHGAGVGLSGPVHGQEHAHPIADKFMSSNSTAHTSSIGTGREPLSSGYTGQIDSGTTGLNLGRPIGGGGEHHGHSHHGHGHSHTVGESTVSGAYEGGAVQNALTGESHAHTTGAGVGFGGENLRATGGNYSSSGRDQSTVSGAYESGPTSNALTGESHAHTTGAGVGFGGENLKTSSEDVGTGVGPAGGSGGHYSQVGAGAGAAGLAAGTAGASGAGGHYLEGGAGAGAAGLAAGSAGAAGVGGNSNKHESGSAGGPISDPKTLDTGGPHSLIFQESTGKYVHRREVE